MEKHRLSSIGSEVTGDLERNIEEECCLPRSLRCLSLTIEQRMVHCRRPNVVSDRQNCCSPCRLTCTSILRSLLDPMGRRSSTNRWNPCHVQHRDDEWVDWIERLDRPLPRRTSCYRSNDEVPNWPEEQTSTFREVQQRRAYTSFVVVCQTDQSTSGDQTFASAWSNRIEDDSIFVSHIETRIRSSINRRHWNDTTDRNLPLQFRDSPAYECWGTTAELSMPPCVSVCFSLLVSTWFDVEKRPHCRFRHLPWFFFFSVLLFSLYVTLSLIPWNRHEAKAFFLLLLLLHRRRRSLFVRAKNANLERRSISIFTRAKGRKEKVRCGNRHLSLSLCSLRMKRKKCNGKLDKFYCCSSLRVLRRCKESGRTLKTVVKGRMSKTERNDVFFSLFLCRSCNE